MFIGIDYSMSCPCYCSLDSDGSFRFMFYTKVLKRAITTKHFRGLYLKADVKGVNRFDIIGHEFAKEIHWEQPTRVCLEGYSYGSRGHVFEIGENTGILKVELFRRNIEPIIIAPPTLKKFATGSGRAGKEDMFEAFKKETKTDLCALYDLKPDKSPCSDMVDAYFLAKRASTL